MKVINVEARSDVDLVPAIRKLLPLVKKYKTLTLVTTVQHVHGLADAQGLLEKEGHAVLINRPSGHALYPGQLLGCDASAALKGQDKTDAIIYIGTGEFHPLAILYGTERPVFSVNPGTKAVKELDSSLRVRHMKKRYARIAKARDAERFGILVSTKPGQNQLDAAIRAQEALEKKGKKAYLFIQDTINPQELLNFPNIQIWVNTACPRITEDQERFSKPLIGLEDINKV